MVTQNSISYVWQNSRKVALSVSTQIPTDFQWDNSKYTAPARTHPKHMPHMINSSYWRRKGKQAMLCMCLIE